MEHTESHGHRGHVINARNVNDALPLGLSLVKDYGMLHTSRGKETLEVPGPVMTIYQDPTQRVLLDPVRDANPFFHFFEALWILAGGRTVHTPAVFLPRITDFSDDDVYFHGAYGYRLRHAFGFDQIETAIRKLTHAPDSRQCVLSIWHPAIDMNSMSKDIPCNDAIAFSVRDNMLHMTVFNRSNDVIWGAYGANAVQFSVLQEYVAARLDTRVGEYTQFSNSFHVYTDLPLWRQYESGEWQPDGHVLNPYMHSRKLSAASLFYGPDDALAAEKDCILFDRLCQEKQSFMGVEFKSVLFQKTALPMLYAFSYYRQDDFEKAFNYAEQIRSSDWRVAVSEWLTRRQVKRGIA